MDAIESCISTPYYLYLGAWAASRINHTRDIHRSTLYDVLVPPGRRQVGPALSHERPGMKAAHNCLIDRAQCLVTSLL